MEGKMNGKREIGEEGEDKGFRKMTGQKLEKGKVDPGGDSVLKLKDEGGQMEEQLRVGKPVKSGKSHGLKHSRSKGSSKTRNDILPRGDEDNPDFDPLEQEEDVNDEVIQISSDDDSGEIEISSDDDGTVDATKGHKETANGEEGSRKELAKSLEAQISAMSLELECPVCLDVCAPPIYTCLAQHPVCSGCRSSLNECAVCREPYKQGMIRHRYVMTSCYMNILEDF